MKILIAEDDLNILKIARLVLERVGGHHVTEATDGKKALELAINGDFDLIILDGMMPGLPGVEVCRQYLDKRQGQSRAQVIFLSAKSSPQDIEEFLELGEGYIQKPFEPQNLCSLIDGIVNKKAA